MTPDEHVPTDVSDREHDCLQAGTLAFVAVYGAPGIGESWTCTTCGKGWARVGDNFWPAEDGYHLLTLDDVE